jgi:TPR repeat protein
MGGSKALRVLALAGLLALPAPALAQDNTGLSDADLEALIGQIRGDGAHMDTSLPRLLQGFGLEEPMGSVPSGLFNAPAPATAPPPRDPDSPAAQGIALMREGDKAAAFPVLLRGASAGDPEAAYLVGRAYRDGEGVAQDATAAHSWFARAATAGSADARVALGREVMDSDPEAAATWFMSAARRSPAAAYWLGKLHDPATGQMPDADASFGWMVEAARGGYIAALLEISRYYCEGIGVEVSPEHAYLWNALAYGDLAYDLRAWKLEGCGGTPMTLSDITGAMTAAAPLRRGVPVYEGWE